MGAGVLDFEIEKYLPLLGNAEKTTILSLIKSFLGQKPDGFEHTDIADYNREIDEAMARMDKGQYTSHEDVEKEMETW